MELKYSVSEQDYIEFAVRFAKARNRKILLSGSIAIVVIFALILVVSQAHLESVIIFALMFLVFVFGMPPLQRHMVKRSAIENIKKAGKDYFSSEKSICLSDEGLELKSSIASSTVPYNNIVKIYSDDKFGYIEIKGGSKCFVPLNTAGLSEFLRALNDRIKK